MAVSDKVRATNSELAEWIAAFLVDKQAANLSAHTIRFYRQYLKTFASYCQGEALAGPEDVSANHFRRFLLWLESEGHNPGGIHAYYRICKTFFRWWEAETEPLDYQRIFDKVKAPKLEDAPLPPVPLEDVKALAFTCGSDWYGLRDKALLLALLDTGARAREFLSLNCEDTNRTTGAVYIAKGKGRKSRTVYLGKDARRALRRYLGPRCDGPLWTTQAGERLSYSALRKMLQKRAALAGVDAPSLHSFRRAFAVNMLRAGVDLETLRRLMGHADYQVLRRYLAMNADDLQRAHALGSPADQLRNLKEWR